MKSKNIKLDTWKQNNPNDQLISLVNALRGELGLIEDRAGKQIKALCRANRWVDEIEILGKKYLPSDDWDNR